jgi:hypothetical protein
MSRDGVQSWAATKALEVFEQPGHTADDHLEKLERAIRETIEKCASVAMDTDLEVRGKRGTFCSDPQAGGEALELAAEQIRALADAP